MSLLMKEIISPKGKSVCSVWYFLLLYFHIILCQVMLALVVRGGGETPWLVQRSSSSCWMTLHLIVRSCTNWHDSVVLNLDSVIKIPLGTWSVISEKCKCSVRNFFSCRDSLWCLVCFLTEYFPHLLQMPKSRLDSPFNGKSQGS